MLSPTRRAAAIAAGTLLTLSVMTGTAHAVSSNSANNPGPYTSGGSTGASGNGNGNGNAVGRPDAGTVGNADNKNPKGQLADAGTGTGNAGYECDTNSGIAKSNPAHTGCNPEGNPEG